MLYTGKRRSRDLFNVLIPLQGYWKFPFNYLYSSTSSHIWMWLMQWQGSVLEGKKKKKKKSNEFLLFALATGFFMWTMFSWRSFQPCFCVNDWNKTQYKGNARPLFIFFPPSRYSFVTFRLLGNLRSSTAWQGQRWCFEHVTEKKQASSYFNRFPHDRLSPRLDVYTLAFIIATKSCGWTVKLFLYLPKVRRAPSTAELAAQTAHPPKTRSWWICWFFWRSFISITASCKDSRGSWGSGIDTV